MKLPAIQALVLTAALSSAQVSERVVREAIALPQSTPFEWQHLVARLRSLGEDELAMMVVDAKAGTTAGNLYRWYRRDRDIDKMVREVQQSFGSPGPLPAVIEEAVYFGGKERVERAYNHIRLHGLVTKRPHLAFLSQGDERPSPEFATYFLLALEGKPEDANAILPRVSADEIRKQLAPLSSVLYFGDPSLTKALLARNPGVVHVPLLSAIATRSGDSDLSGAVLHELLYGAVAVPQELGLALQLFESGQRATAVRVMSHNWEGFVESLIGKNPPHLPSPLLAALHNNGFDERLADLARLLLAEAKSQLSNGVGLVEDSSSSPAEHYRLALRIAVCRGSDAEAERIISEFDDLYAHRERSMSLADGSLRGEKIAALFEYGRFEEAVEEAIAYDLGPIRLNVFEGTVSALIEDGDREGAQGFLKKYLGRAIKPESRAFGHNGYRLVEGLIEPLVDLGMREELRALLKGAYGEPQENRVGSDALVAVKGYLAIGDMLAARQFARLATTRHVYGEVVGELQTATWLSFSDPVVRAIGREHLAVSIGDLLDRKIDDGSFVGRFPRAWATDLVDTLAFIQNDERLTRVVLDCIARLFASLKPEVRAAVEYAALTSAIGNNAQPTKFYQPPPRLSVELQDRVLRAIVESRPKRNDLTQRR